MTLCHVRTLNFAQHSALYQLPYRPLTSASKSFIIIKFRHFCNFALVIKIFFFFIGRFQRCCGWLSRFFAETIFHFSYTRYFVNSPTRGCSERWLNIRDRTRSHVFLLHYSLEYFLSHSHQLIYDLRSKPGSESAKIHGPSASLLHSLALSLSHSLTRMAWVSSRFVASFFFFIVSLSLLRSPRSLAPQIPVLHSCLYFFLQFFFYIFLSLSLSFVLAHSHSLVLLNSSGSFVASSLGRPGATCWHATLGALSLEPWLVAHHTPACVCCTLQPRRVCCSTDTSLSLSFSLSQALRFFHV